MLCHVKTCKTARIGFVAHQKGRAAAGVEEQGRSDASDLNAVFVGGPGCTAAVGQRPDVNPGFKAVSVRLYHKTFRVARTGRKFQSTGSALGKGE